MKDDGVVSVTDMARLRDRIAEQQSYIDWLEDWIDANVGKDARVDCKKRYAKTRAVK